MRVQCFKSVWHQLAQTDRHYVGYGLRWLGYLRDHNVRVSWVKAHDSDQIITMKRRITSWGEPLVGLIIGIKVIPITGAGAQMDWHGVCSKLGGDVNFLVYIPQGEIFYEGPGKKVGDLLWAESVWLT